MNTITRAKINKPVILFINLFRDVNIKIFLFSEAINSTISTFCEEPSWQMSGGRIILIDENDRIRQRTKKMI